MVNAYSTRRTTSRWPLSLFLKTMDSAALNACVIWTERHQGWMSASIDRQRKFLLGLGKEIASPQIRRRVDNPAYLYKDILQCIRSLIPVQEIKKPRGNKVQGCCSVCPRNRERKLEPSVTTVGT
jgi:hypothetical protein